MVDARATSGDENREAIDDLRLDCINTESWETATKEHWKEERAGFQEMTR